MGWLKICNGIVFWFKRLIEGSNFHLIRFPRGRETAKPCYFVKLRIAGLIGAKGLVSNEMANFKESLSLSYEVLGFDLIL